MVDEQGSVGTKRPSVAQTNPGLELLQAVSGAGDPRFTKYCTVASLVSASGR